VAKILSDKKVQCVKNLRNAVILAHEELNVQIKSTDGKANYKRGRKNLGLTYVHPVKKRVRKVNTLFEEDCHFSPSDSAQSYR
jgi:hypothetical protein